MKETFLPNIKAVILHWFSDNYLFLCQNALWRFHWETERANLHPSFSFLLLHSRVRNHMNEECVNLCDCLELTATAVCSFTRANALAVGSVE
jgi:hypothetical protein